MNDENKLREQICLLAKSIYDRGLTGGSTGNISSRTSDGGLLVSPTGTSFGRLDPSKLSRFDSKGVFISGDPEMGKAVRGLAGKRSAIMLANHGPVVAGKDIEAACNAIEELEDTARLAMMTRGMNARLLNASQVKSIVKKFDVEWDS